MERNKLRIWLAMALAALLCSQADARLIESWSLQRIKDTAGLVLVGTVASTGHTYSHGAFSQCMQGTGWKWNASGFSAAPSV